MHLYIIAPLHAIARPTDSKHKCMLECRDIKRHNVTHVGQIHGWSTLNRYHAVGRLGHMVATPPLDHGRLSLHVNGYEATWESQRVVWGNAPLLIARHLYSAPLIARIPATYQRNVRQRDKHSMYLVLQPSGAAVTWSCSHA